MKDSILNFCPIAVARIQNKLKPLMEDPKFKSGRKTGMNISYSIGYLEFLNQILLHKNLHLTLQVMIIKNFIITSMSIVESLFYYVYKTKSLDQLVTNKTGNKTRKNDVKFITVLGAIKENGVLANVDFEELRVLYDKRNKIHIHSENKTAELDNHHFKAFYPSLVPKTVRALNSVLVASGFFDETFIKELKFNLNSYQLPKSEDYPF